MGLDAEGYWTNDRVLSDFVEEAKLSELNRGMVNLNSPPKNEWQKHF